MKNISSESLQRSSNLIGARLSVKCLVSSAAETSGAQAIPKRLNGPKNTPGTSWQTLL